MEEITIVEVPDQLVLGMRKRGAYQEIATMLPKLFEYALGRSVPIVAGPMFVCHEASIDEVKEADKNKNADVEVALPVGARAEETEEIKCYELAGGKMAKIIHKGPYEQCEPTYRKLFDWISRQHKALTGPTREVYLNDPRTVAPQEILTEIYAPIG